MEKLKIGKIVGTHGLKGELKLDQIVILLIKDLKRKRNYYTLSNQDWSIKLLHTRIHKGNYLVSFRDNQDINWLKI